MDKLPATLTDDDIVHLFFQCRNDDPKGIYVGQGREAFNLLEFGRKLEETLHARLVEGRQWPENFKTMRRL